MDNAISSKCEKGLLHDISLVKIISIERKINKNGSFTN